MNKKIFAFSLLFFSLTVFSQTKYVRSLKAVMYDGPSKKSKVIGKLKRGKSLKIIKTQGLWEQGKVGSKKGWVMKLMLSSAKPSSRKSLLYGGSSLKSTARKRASSFTSAGAARGLRESKKEFSKLNFKINVKDVELMESFYTSPRKAAKYISVK